MEDFIPLKPPFVPLALFLPENPDKIRGKGRDTMLRLLKLELRKLLKPVTAATALLTVLTCILTCVLQREYTVYFRIDTWEIGTEYLGLLFPLFVTVPICWQLYYERRNRFLAYTLPRVSKKTYLTSKWMACALSAFCILLVPYVLSLLCALYVVEPQYLFPMPEKYSHFLLPLYAQYPLVYGLLLSVWKALLGVLTMTFGFVLALFSKNIFVVLTAPFIYVILDNFFWSNLRVANAFVFGFEPGVLSPDYITPVTFAFGPIQMLLILTLIVLFYTKVKKRTIYVL